MPLPTDDLPEVALQTAADVVGELAEILEIKKGGNSRVYKLTSATRSCILKRVAAGREAELLNECQAYALLQQHGIDRVPHTLHHGQPCSWALFSHLQGDTPAVQDLDSSDIAQFVEFIRQLKNLSASARPDFGKASDACLSRRDMLLRISARRRDFQPDPMLSRDFAMASLLGTWDDAWQALCDKNSSANEKTFYQQELASGAQILSPSDFGPHNAKRHHGQWFFLDFEYFGWDDPAKLIVDFVWHPANPLDDSLKKFWLQSCLQLWQDEILHERVRTIMPFHGLKWCLIALNIFSVHHARRRAFLEQPHSAVENFQARFETARHLLASVQTLLHSNA